MVVLTLGNCPSSLRGDITKWLVEINTGVFVGKISARVRDLLWERVCESIKQGSATMVYTARNEQHMEFRTHNNQWEPIDFDGIKLVLRPSAARVKKQGALRLGYSKASKNRKAKRYQ